MVAESLLRSGPDVIPEEAFCEEDAIAASPPSVAETSGPNARADTGAKARTAATDAASQDPPAQVGAATGGGSRVEEEALSRGPEVAEAKAVSTHAEEPSRVAGATPSTHAGGFRARRARREPHGWGGPRVRWEDPNQLGAPLLFVLDDDDWQGDWDRLDEGL